MPDVMVQNEGSLWLFTPLTEVARSWIAANVDPGAQWFGRALVAEHRFGPALWEGMLADGLKVAA